MYSIVVIGCGGIIGLYQHWITISHGYAATKKYINSLVIYILSRVGIFIFFEFNDDETWYDFYKTWMYLGQDCDKIGWAWDFKCIQMFFGVVHIDHICQWWSMRWNRMNNCYRRWRFSLHCEVLPKSQENCMKLVNQL